MAERTGTVETYKVQLIRNLYHELERRWWDELPEERRKEIGARGDGGVLSEEELAERNLFIDNVSRGELMDMIEAWKKDWADALAESGKEAEGDDILAEDAADFLVAEMANW